MKQLHVFICLEDTDTHTHTQSTLAVASGSTCASFYCANQQNDSTLSIALIKESLELLSIDEERGGEC